jgi:GNAT superfamily N-acetyltransferase
MTGFVVTLLTPERAADLKPALASLLVDAVESGAAVNFVWPMTRAKAEAWWDGALASHAQGERLIFVAQADGRIDGTVQLILAPQENQSFRADLAKMIVHRRARRQGIGAALMRAAEDEALRLGRTLLTLDTQSDEAGERLYAAMGWTKVGEIPGYATNPDGQGRHGASLFYKSLA